MKDKTTAIEELKESVQAFARARDWSQYHSPKNLAMGLAIEAAELMEHFLWKTQSQSEIPEDRDAVAMELADIFIYTLNLASRLGIDLAACTEKKLAENDRKYPVKLVKGKAHKHTHYRDRIDQDPRREGRKD